MIDDEHPSSSAIMDKDENTAIVSPTQRFMTQVKAIPANLTHLLLSAILFVLLLAYNNVLEQPHIDEKQDLRRVAIEKDVVEVKAEMSELNGELKSAVTQLTELNTKFAVLLAKLDRDGK